MTTPAPLVLAPPLARALDRIRALPGLRIVGGTAIAAHCPGRVPRDLDATVPILDRAEVERIVGHRTELIRHPVPKGSWHLRLPGEPGIAQTDILEKRDDRWCEEPVRCLHAIPAAHPTDLAITKLDALDTRRLVKDWSDLVLLADAGADLLRAARILARRRPGILARLEARYPPDTEPVSDRRVRDALRQAR